MRLIRKIIIPTLVREIKVSDKRNPTYYIMTPGEPIELPRKYQDATKYGFLKIKRGKREIDMLCLLPVEGKAAEKVIKNPIAVGTPKYIRINFQRIWDSTIATHTRNKMATDIKASYWDALSKVEPITEGFPLKTNFTLHSKNETQDVDNLLIIYIKTFHDALTESKVIPDDKLKYLKRFEGGHEESETEYLEIDIYSMNNE